MAVTKIHGIKTTVDKAIEYICNPDKTDEKIYISSFACAPETAALDFKFTLDHTSVSSNSQRKDSENKAFHLIQAFEPGEISYEEAHVIGKKLADKILESKYSYVLTTHIDKGHVHNHIIFCAADNINYNHYHDCKKSYWRIRNISDQLCREHGLSVIESSGNRGKKYNEWHANQNNQSIKSKIRQDINQTIKAVSSYEEFLAFMNAKGYEIKNASLDDTSGKYISFRPIGKKHFIRGSIKSLGEKYTKEQINQRIKSKKKTILEHCQTLSKPRKYISTSDSNTFLNNPALYKWSVKENLKTAAQAYNQMISKNIHSFTELTDQISLLQQLSKTTNDTILSIDHQLRDLAETIKYAEQYIQNKPFHDQYENAVHKDNLFQKYESHIILFSGAERILLDKGFNLCQLDSKKLKSIYQELSIKKKELLTQMNTYRKQIKGLESLQDNLQKYILPSPNITKLTNEKDMI